MSIQFKALIAGSALFAIAGAANAEDRFSVEFSYDPAAPVETIYDDLQQTARTACRSSLRQNGSVGQKSRAERACRAQVVESVIAASGNAGLVAFHAGMTSPRIARRQYAGAK